VRLDEIDAEYDEVAAGSRCRVKAVGFDYQVMRKMRADSLPALVTMAARLGTYRPS
jgi:hypothetical protein